MRMTCKEVVSKIKGIHGSGSTCVDDLKLEHKQVKTRGASIPMAFLICQGQRSELKYMDVVTIPVTGGGTASCIVTDYPINHATRYQQKV